MEPDTATETAIEVQDLVKRYPHSSANAVDGISFAVRRGEIFGLLGPNGAGKTTTIGVLMAFVRQTSGTARIMGVDVNADPITAKQHIAAVPQQSNLDRSLRVREILTFHAAYHGVPRRERKARAQALLTELGLADRAKDSVARYSGGMAQRLMIARALMHSPDVLFLDEPTNNLDPQSRLFLWDRIRALNEQGLTILLTTHDMEEADKLCERIAIMDYGKILVNDTSAALKTLIPGGNTLEVRIYVPELAAVAAGGGSSAIDATGQRSSATARVRDALRALPGVSQVDELGGPAAAPLGAGLVGTDGASAGGGWPGSDGGGGRGGQWPGMGGAPGAGPAVETEPGVTTFRLYASETAGLLAAAAQSVLATGAELRDLHVSHASLEDVFIYLTGRQLR